VTYAQNATRTSDNVKTRIGPTYAGIKTFLKIFYVSIYIDWAERTSSSSSSSTNVNAALIVFQEDCRAALTNIDNWRLILGMLRLAKVQKVQLTVVRRRERTHHMSVRLNSTQLPVELSIIVISSLWTG